MANNKTEPRVLQGTMELLPPDQILFNRMYDTIRETYESFGFLPLDTPVLEYSNVLLAKAGGETEKQIFRFTKGDNDLSMRFDLTVPLARYVALHKNDLVFPFKRYQMGKVYRGERPQKGRYREFYQCDIDIIGSDELDLMYDAEMPAVIYNVFTKLNFGEFVIRITFEFKAVKFSTWGNADAPTFLSNMTPDYFASLLFTYAVLVVLFSIGVFFMGKDVKKFAIAFTGLFILSWIAYIFAAQATLKNYVEYAFWALVVGLLICNTIGTPEWLKPALISEYYVKTGLVVMGAEVLFANITNFGIYGLAIAWFVTPVVIIFMWLFGTKFLKM
nr:putative sulfate exporter family transporter [Clostridia bacterium]